MVAYRVSKESNVSTEEKIELINGYDTRELLKVVREFEDNPRKFEPEIIKLVSSRLYEKGIYLM